MNKEKLKTSIKRELASRSLISYIHQTFPAYKADPVHFLISDYLTKVVEGKINRLMIFAPPQHGKPLDVETKVMLWDYSYKRLGDIQVGDKVITHKGRPREVLAVFEQNSLPTILIMTYSGRNVVSSYEHPFLTNEGWIQAGNLDVVNSALKYVSVTDKVEFIDDPVVFIHEFGMRPCRCLTIEEDETFTANDFVVHNSEAVSIRLPTYWLGRRPDDPIILSSYAASLALTKSREARRLVESEEYLKIFPNIDTNHASRAVQRWELGINHKGYMLACGVGGPITGHGAMLGIIDDPFENWAAAQSPTIRAHIWDWYRGTFRTRIWEHGAIVIIMTRWHQDDLCGMLLQSQPGDWNVLRLPAVAETQEERDTNNQYLGLPLGEKDPLNRQPGDPLCPSRFSKEALDLIKRDVGSMAWAAEYQGVPRPAEGNRLKRHWFEIVPSVPAEAGYHVRFWDKASSDKKSADYTVGLLMSWHDGTFYIEDVVRGRWTPGERRAIMRQTAEMDYTMHNENVIICIEAEGGSSGKDAVHDERRFLAGFAVRSQRPTGSKEVRAEPFAAQAEGGNIKLLKGAWNFDYLEEITSFPNGTHDDQVDASSGAFSKVVKMAMPQYVKVYHGSIG